MATLHPAKATETSEGLRPSGTLLENEGAYQYEVIDQQWGLISLKRTYYSRTIFKGVFGWGWCSFLDLKIENNLLHDCWTDQKVLLSISTEENQFLWKRQNITYRFDAAGNLIQIDSGKDTVRIERTSEGVPLAILHNGRKTRMTTHLNSSKSLKIRAIGHVSYHYNQQQLAMVKKKNRLQNPQTSYHYDDFENLVKIENGRKKTELITYDIPNDLAIKVAVFKSGHLQ